MTYPLVQFETNRRDISLAESIADWIFDFSFFLSSPSFLSFDCACVRSCSIMIIRRSDCSFCVRIPSNKPVAIQKNQTGKSVVFARAPSLAFNFFCIHGQPCTVTLTRCNMSEQRSKTNFMKISICIDMNDNVVREKA